MLRGAMSKFGRGLAEASSKKSAVARQRRSIAEKRRIVEETLLPGASVARVARAHGINANQVFGWRRLYLAGRLGAQKAGMKLRLGYDRALFVSGNDCYLLGRVHLRSKWTLIRCPLGESAYHL